MISTHLMKLAEQNGWKVNTKEESVFGVYNDYLFTVLEGNRFKAFITPVAGISPAALETVMDYLEKQRKLLRLHSFEAHDNFLCVRMEEGMVKLSADKLEYMLGQISGLLSLQEVPADACVVCGQPAARRGLYVGLFCNLHTECENADMVEFTPGTEPAGETET
ncbi:MAG: hypothetical protein GX112_09885 [Clostridiaceae bacterium]|jgi:hypothetical protein|nr:hypothetical protein [Clostridiaceae bacterium]